MKRAAEDIASLGFSLQWSQERAAALKSGDTLLWVHGRRHRMGALPPTDSRLLRRVEVIAMTPDIIVTDFGKYHLSNGRNLFAACGCKRFCDCYGSVYLPAEQVIIY